MRAYGKQAIGRSGFPPEELDRRARRRLADHSGAGLTTAHARCAIREAFADGCDQFIGHDGLAEHAGHVEPACLLGRCGSHDDDRDVLQLRARSDLLLHRRSKQIRKPDRPEYCNMLKEHVDAPIQHSM